MSSAEKSLREVIAKIIARNPDGLTFEELRNQLEAGEQIYIDGVELRKTVAEMIRQGTICKEPSPQRKKMLLKLCSQIQQ